MNERKKGLEVDSGLHVHLRARRRSRKTEFRPLFRLGCATLLVLATVDPLWAGAVELNVTRVGFPILPDGQMIRPGTWTPIIVDLSLLDQSGFDGTLRTAQLDNDGDEGFDSVEVHLLAQTGGTQRVCLYTMANPLRSQGRFTVELRDMEGETVEVVSQGELTRRARPAQRPVTIEPDNLFILSVSSGTIGRVVDLISPDQENIFVRRITIGHMSPTDLPELWLGLEAVDCIVWDEARPEDLTERQLEALIEWVGNGGRLLIFASRTAGSLAGTKSIKAVLPVDLGEVVAVDDLPEVRSRLLQASSGDKGYAPPVPVVRCTLREGSSLIQGEEAIGSDLVTRRSVGLGQVIFTGITQRDLFSAPGRAAYFYTKVFHLCRKADPEVAPPEPRSLFADVVGAVSFAQSGGLYLFIAGCCSIGYVLLATFGSWRFLGTRGWRHHSWSAFALVGLVVSFLSVIAVNSAQGFGQRLHQLSIVDAEAGESYGRATAFFGLKTGLDRQLDVWLPSDPAGAVEPGPTNCFLRPIPPGNDPREALSSYADPQEYRLVPGSAVVEDVRIRATLKQFEGRWQGRIGGQVTGEITVKRISTPWDWRFTEDSYIVNDLGVDLKRCYLLHTLFDIEDSWDDRDQEIYAYMIGDLPADGTKVLLAPRCYIQAYEDKAVLKEMKKHLLPEEQKDWSRPFETALRGLQTGRGSKASLAFGEEQHALLLLSTLGDFTPLPGSGWRGEVTWSRDRLRRLDLHERLDKDSVFLIGFADDPGPVRLFNRQGDRPYKICEPDPKRSWTMYRIRIPITVLGGPTPGDEDAELDPYEIG